MSVRKSRELVFVCVALLNNELFTKIIPASASGEAIKIFTEQFKIAPNETLGPFIKKSVKVVPTNKTFKFTNQIKKAVYGDWLVNAFILTEPQDNAYLVFIKRLDDKKIPFPKGNVTVPVCDLRFI